MNNTFSNTQIDLKQLPKVEDLDFKKIEKSYFKIILLNVFFTYSVIIAVLLVIKRFVDQDTLFYRFFWYALSGLIISCIVQVIIYKLGFKKRKYALREKDITYSHGYVYNSTITLPYNRIQHIEIKRSFIARKLGLSTLKIFSAGESGSDLTISGLPESLANSQYAFLTSILNER